jgi:hypothetical protein
MIRDPETPLPFSVSPCLRGEGVGRPITVSSDYLITRFLAFPMSAMTSMSAIRHPSRVPLTRKTKHLVWDIPSVPFRQLSEV